MTVVMRKRKRRKRALPVQLTLDHARKPDGKHGGWRPGAGRPRGRTKVPHITREAFPSGKPLHVTWRIAQGVPSLRREAIVEAVRTTIALCARGDDFRIVEFNVLGNHMHFVVEATNKRALARGMQGLARRLTHKINGILGRTGKLFAERYHARVLSSPLEVRNALRYVLLNARHHAAERGEKLARRWVDPFSSGTWFGGWNARVDTEPEWIRRLAKRERPTATARTWLLATGWKRHGLIAFDDVPG